MLMRVLAHLHYARYVARHKLYVYRAGRKLGAPIHRLLIHDWSKLTHSEWTPYVHMFYRPDIHKDDKQDAFDRAWLHHQRHNLHHWQSWILRNDDGRVIALEMPERYARELVADWAGAARAITGSCDVRPWYEKNRGKIMLHPQSRELIERLLDLYFT